MRRGLIFTHTMSTLYIRNIFILLSILTLFTLNYVKYPFVFYLYLNIPGAQMAITIPPFGIFIESQYRHEDPNDPCSILIHEQIHWKQYKRMGLFSFYFNYIKCYVHSGRINNWMEREARKPCSSKRNHRPVGFIP